MYAVSCNCTRRHLSPLSSALSGKMGHSVFVLRYYCLFSLCPTAIWLRMDQPVLGQQRINFRIGRWCFVYSTRRQVFMLHRWRASIIIVGLRCCDPIGEEERIVRLMRCNTIQHRFLKSAVSSTVVLYSDGGGSNSLYVFDLNPCRVCIKKISAPCPK